MFVFLSDHRWLNRIVFIAVKSTKAYFGSNHITVQQEILCLPMLLAAFQHSCSDTLFFFTYHSLMLTCFSGTPSITQVSAFRLKRYVKKSPYLHHIYTWSSFLKQQNFCTELHTFFTFKDGVLACIGLRLTNPAILCHLTCYFSEH